MNPANKFFSKKSIFWMSLIALIAGVAAIILYPLTYYCSAGTTTNQPGCTTSGPLGVFGAILFVLVTFVATVLTIVVWLLALVKTGRIRAWVWFVLCFLLPPVTTLLYGIFGPELPEHGRPGYVEGTPRHPVTS